MREKTASSGLSYLEQDALGAASKMPVLHLTWIAQFNCDNVSTSFPLSPCRFAEGSFHYALATRRRSQAARRRPEPDPADEAALRQPKASCGSEFHLRDVLHQGRKRRLAIWRLDSARGGRVFGQCCEAPNSSRLRIGHCRRTSP